jgi:cytochrome c oxidase assembly protein subunit 15
MPADSVARWIRRLCILGVLLCFAVVVLGAYVRLTAAGLGCPDWPGCYGQLTPAGAQTADTVSAFPGRPLEPGKAWREMSHRYAVGTLSVIIVFVTALVLNTRRQRLASVPLALTLFATLVMQALLGMLTVTWRLNPLIVTLHLLFGMTTLALFWWLLLSLPRGPWSVATLQNPDHAVSGGGASTLRLARWLTLLGLAVLAVQIALGGWTSSNYAAVACPDFPTCQSAWWPHGDYRNAFVLWRGLGTDYEGGAHRHSSDASFGCTGDQHGARARRSFRAASARAARSARAGLGSACCPRAAAHPRRHHGAQELSATVGHGPHRRCGAAAADNTRAVARTESRPQTCPRVSRGARSVRLEDRARRARPPPKSRSS